ncbi:MAG TPA: efflux RND transporter periplasmic adaptor subunit [Patescibacteria group bacterium]|nr:efflux RND transporter periplasmic adaptor subunit [Patescibacteria group bacterium]
MKNHKKLAIIVGIIAAFIIFLIFLLQPSSQSFVYTVKRENLVNTLLINGTFTTASQVQVNSPADGIIFKLYVSNGDEVKKGDPLFHVESTATDEEKAAAYANYLSASSAVETDKATLYSLQSIMFADWKNYTDLSTNSTYENSDKSPNTTNRVLPEFTTAQDNWLAAEANYKDQQSVIAKDQAALNSATLSYNATQDITVNSPAAGSVVNLQKKVGDQIQSVQTSLSAQTQSGQSANVIPPVLVVSDLSDPVITASVDQVNIPRIKIGQKANIVFDALPNQTFTGDVQSLDTVGTITQGTTDYNVGIEVNHVSSQIMPNMTASITLETARKENILTIPNNAIISKNGENFVQLANTNKNNLTEVVLGLQGLTKTEVVSGLVTGDKVMIPQ